MRRRGFSMVEVLIVIAVLTFGFLALLTVYMTNLRHATMTRSHLLASVRCESLLAEIREHRYGTPAPLSWGDRLQARPALQVVPVWVQGRPVDTSFETLVTVGPGGNGSFFDSSKSDSTDVIYCVVRWVEGTEASETRRDMKYELTMLARREPNLVVPIR